MSSDNHQILYSLIFNCPFDLECADCPFINIYKKDIDERFEFVENLQKVEREMIVETHFELFQKNYDANKQRRIG